MRATLNAAIRRPLRRTWLTVRDVAPALLTLALLGAAFQQSCTLSGARFAEAGDAAGEPEIRVRIARDQSEAVIGSAARIEIASPRIGKFAGMQPPITVKLNQQGWVLSAPGQAPLTFDRTDALVLRSSTGASLALGASAYPGHFRFYPRADLSPGAFDVVEHVPLETYIAGVVTREMYPRWSSAAYETQAVAARTYALHERNRRGLRGEASDIDSTENDQVYGGVTPSDAAVAATRATRGQVIMWAGSLLRAYYSSTCGGRSASARDIWPTTNGFEFNLAGPIQGAPRDHACQSSPLYRWVVTRDASDVVRRLSAWGQEQKHNLRQIKSIAKIEAATRNDVERPNSYRITDASGKSWTISAEQLRVALNYSTGKSIPSVTKETRISSGDFEATFSGSGKGAKVTFSGRGFGHGVGMCQFCAEGFARRGDTSKAMLERFYPGATIRKMY